MEVDPLQDASSCSAVQQAITMPIIYVGSEEKFAWKTSEINLRNTFSGNFPGSRTRNAGMHIFPK